jgi:hypothetical protein
MPDFQNLDQLFQYLNQVNENIMANEVADKVKSIQSEMVEEVVYDAYDPYVYERRGDYGGLSDTRNMIHTVTSTMNGLQLIIRNVTTGSKNSNFEIAGLIEYGHDNGHGVYEYNYNRAGTEQQFMQPRPFISETIKRLEQSLEHVQAYQSGLIRLGHRFS